MHDGPEAGNTHGVDSVSVVKCRGASAVCGFPGRGKTSSARRRT